MHIQFFLYLDSTINKVVVAFFFNIIYTFVLWYFHVYWFHFKDLKKSFCPLNISLTDCILLGCIFYYYMEIYRSAQILTKFARSILRDMTRRQTTLLNSLHHVFTSSTLLEEKDWNLRGLSESLQVSFEDEPTNTISRLYTQVDRKKLAGGKLFDFEWKIE